MPVMLTTSKQIMAYPGLRLPKGYLVATRPGSIPRSLVPNIIHRLSLPSAMAYATRTPPLTCQVRDAVPVIRWREALTNAIRKTGSCSITTKENACASVSVDIPLRGNRVWQKDNRRCKLMVYTERRCTLLWAQKLMYTSLFELCHRSTALKALAEYSALFTIIAKNYDAYTFQAVSLVSAKLSRLYCPARLTVNFACWVAIIEIQEETEDMKYETLCADLLETAYGVCTEYRTDLIKISCTT
ncbi:hypothetical protein ALC62_09484 [Cyphomyrmex costatus]|uniref:Uncharacterized protein n=1 Tax=Cyphomyrmex costatus TaxID=456900 RepID=A0A195CGK9_9HYME|nr:hypothetical protein ALC62_09484 [Cyphomyrmex costatus]